MGEYGPRPLVLRAHRLRRGSDLVLGDSFPLTAEVGVLLHLLSFRPGLGVCLYPGPVMIALQGTPMHPPNELFSEVLPSGCELPRRPGNNRMELDVMGSPRSSVTAEKRSGLCLLYARRNMGRGLRRACGTCA